MIRGLVSVVIPVKNLARTVEFCLTSLHRQTYPSLEIIIVDNGSTDETIHIVEQHSVTVGHAGGSMPSARNVGAGMAKGEYLLHIDSDMELHSEAIAQCVECAERGADVVILPEQNVTRGYWMKAFSFNKQLVQGVKGREHGRFVRTEWFQRVGGYDESLLSGEDRDFFLRLLNTGARSGYISAVTKHHVEHLTIADIFRKTAQYTRTREAFVTKHTLDAASDKLILLQLLRQRWRLMIRHPLLTVGWFIVTALFVIRDAILLYWIRNAGLKKGLRNVSRGVVHSMTKNNGRANRRVRIVVLLSELEAHDGIQRYNRSLCKVLSEYAQRRGIDLQILSLHDRPGFFDENYLLAPLVGCSGHRGLFILNALVALVRPCDVVVGGHVDFVPLVAFARGVHRCTKAVALTHGVEVWTRLPFYERAALSKLEQVWTVSAYTAQQLVAEQDVVPSAIRVVTDILDPDFLADALAWQSSGRQGISSRLLTIARLTVGDRYKGVDRVISALPKVRRLIPDVNCTVIGDGNDRPYLQKLARTCGVSEIVHFAGRVSDEQLHAYLSGTDVLVLPSRKEGFGLVFLEAAAYHKPVVAGAHGGSPEVVVDGETGLLVHYDDQSALVGAITALLQSPGKRKALGEAGFQRVQSVYGYDDFRSTISQLLDGLLSPIGKGLPDSARPAALL